MSLAVARQVAAGALRVLEGLEGAPCVLRGAEGCPKGRCPKRPKGPKGWAQGAGLAVAEPRAVHSWTGNPHWQSLRTYSTDSKGVKAWAGEAELCKESDEVVLRTKDADDLRFPFVWLRDNCQCSACFHQDSQSRTIDLESFDINSKPKLVKVVGNKIHITWLDGHISDYDFEWLKERSFQSHSQESWLTSMYRLPRKTWTAQSFNKILTRYKFSDVLKSDAVLYNWLVSLATYGVSIVEDAPAESTTVRQLAERVAFIRRTHYGEEFSVRAKPGTTNVAYLSANLQLHTDLPYYNYKPGVNLLHCLVQTESDGGSNLLTDSLAVADWLKTDFNSSYQALTQTVVDWNDIGQEDGNYFHSIHRAPVICEDRFGEIERINFSQPQRDSHFNVPLDKVKLWYKAMDKFTKAIMSNDYCVTYKMAEGEILTFDNIRLVHGRKKYDDSGNSIRHVIGGYLDWDEIWSRIRVLKNV